jgi:hypothetical protein
MSHTDTLAWRVFFKTGGSLVHQYKDLN